MIVLQWYAEAAHNKKKAGYFYNPPFHLKQCLFIFPEKDVHLFVEKEWKCPPYQKLF